MAWKPPLSSPDYAVSGRAVLDRYAEQCDKLTLPATEVDMSYSGG